MVSARQAQEIVNSTGIDVKVGWPSISWPSSFVPDLGWPVWAIGSLFLAGGAFYYAIKHGRIFVNPPPYFGCAVNRDPMPSRTTREYRDPRTGKHEEITIFVKGKDGKSVEQKVLRTETFWEPQGIYTGSKINYPGHYVDENDWILPIGYRYDPETGENVPIGPTPSVVEDEAEDQIAPVGNDSRFPRIHKANEIVRNFGNSSNGYIARNFGYQYLGNWWLIEWAAMHDWIWWERGVDGVPFRRRNRQRYFPLTVKTSAIEMSEELIDAFGFPWSVRISVQTKVRNIGIAVVQVPDSMGQLVGLVRGNVTEAWQSLKIIDYEGLNKQVKEVDGRPVPPTPDQVSETAGQSEVKIGTDTNLQELLLDYLKESKEWRRIMNQLGREVVAIVVESKALEGGYADAIAKVRKAELTKKEMITLSEGREESMKKVARGMEAQIGAIQKGGAAGIAAVESGMFNEGGTQPMDPLQKLATATLYPKIAEVQRGEKDNGSDSSQNQSRGRQGQGGRNRR